MNTIEGAKWLLRAGLAFVFVYASIEIYLNPGNFLKYIPSDIIQMVPITPFLHFFGVLEVLLACWLLSGWKGEYPSIVSVLLIAGIVVVNMEHFQVLFRNVAIVFGGLALALLELTTGKQAKA